MEEMPRCMYCRRQEGRNELAGILEANTGLQGEVGSHLLRDGSGRFSVTGMAADRMAGALWVRHEGRFHCFHPEWFHDQSLVLIPGTRRYRQNWAVDDRTMEQLIHEGGAPDRESCPEEVLNMLGIDTENEVPGIITLNRSVLDGEHAELAGGATTLDDLDFMTAARLLREVPELLDGCRCQTLEEWLLDINLRPEQIILLTGDPADVLTEDDLILAAAVMEAPERVKKLDAEDGRQVLRASTWMHRGRMPPASEANPAGAGLSAAALDLREPLEELGQAEGRLRAGAERRYREARLEVMHRHGLAPEGAEQVLEKLKGERDG